jgi:GNAT superfamily N-acetyltransferase
MVIVVPPSSPARRIGRPDEAELHLLAVARTSRNAGTGRRLVEAALADARALGLPRVVLWTQVAMHAARHLYERSGFVRAPARDFSRDHRAFLVYERSIMQ